MSEYENEAISGGHTQMPGPHTAPSGSRRSSMYIQTGPITSASTRRSGSFSRRLSTFPRGERLHMGRQSVYSVSEVSGPIKTTTPVENTYQLGPKPEQEFKVTEIHKVIEEILEEGIRDHKYNEKATPRHACYLTQRIQDSVKKFHCPRHKLCCHVVVGQNLRQGIHMASQCVWSPDTDTSTTVSVKNSSLFAVATVYGLYYE